MSDQQPEDVSLDWEAILTPSLHDFAAANRPWLTRACRPCGAAGTAKLEELPSVAEVFGTARRVLEALTAADEA